MVAVPYPNGPLARIRSLKVGETAAFSTRLKLTGIFDQNDIAAAVRKMRDDVMPAIQRAKVSMKDDDLGTAEPVFATESGNFITSNWQNVIVVLHVVRES